MKKLMIAAAIVCAAVMSQAATVNWKSGTMYNPVDASGGWSSSSKVANKAADGFLFMLTEAQYTALTKDGFSQAAIYDAFTANGASSTLKIGTDTITAINTATAGMNTITLKGGDVTLSSDQVWAAIVYTMSDATLGDFYMANAASYTGYTGTGTPQVGNLATAIGGSGTAKSPTELGWQSVPEPTSGLLLLLGVAGLALRRRRA